MQWIANNWQALCAGAKLYAPTWWLAHPQRVPGFERVLGWPKSQTCDWALSYSDGSRIHIQCYRALDGTVAFLVHRDKWDPVHSPAHAVMHLLFETPVGPALGLAAMTTVLVSAATAASAPLVS